MDETLLSRVENAGINAAAAPQQRWLDGWLLRFSPGKAKRARCINALAPGRLTLDRKLELAGEVYAGAALPMVVRLTRFSQPAALDAELAARGWSRFDDTHVMVQPSLPAGTAVALPPGLDWSALDAAAYAEAVGALRGSLPPQRAAHAERLIQSPVRYRGFAIRRDGDGQVLACGQYAMEAELVGLYDVFTREEVRGQGLAHLLCQRLLSLAANDGAKVGYLQVDAGNVPARCIYARLGFVDAYGYHYRQPPAASEP